MVNSPRQGICSGNSNFFCHYFAIGTSKWFPTYWIILHSDLSRLPNVVPNEYYNLSSVILTCRPYQLNSEYASASWGCQESDLYKVFGFTRVVSLDNRAIQWSLHSEIQWRVKCKETGSKQQLLQWAQLLNQQQSPKNLLELVILRPGPPYLGQTLWSTALLPLHRNGAFVMEPKSEELCPEVGSFWGLYNAWILNITTGRRLWILTVRLLPGPLGSIVQKEGELELSSLGDTRVISTPCLRKQWYPRTWEHIVLVTGLSLPGDSLCIVC